MPSRPSHHIEVVTTHSDYKIIIIWTPIFGETSGSLRVLKVERNGTIYGLCEDYWVDANFFGLSDQQQVNIRYIVWGSLAVPLRFYLRLAQVPRGRAGARFWITDDPGNDGLWEYSDVTYQKHNGAMTIRRLLPDYYLKELPRHQRIHNRAWPTEKTDDETTNRRFEATPGPTEPRPGISLDGEAAPCAEERADDPYVPPTGRKRSGWF